MFFKMSDVHRLNRMESRLNILDVNSKCTSVGDSICVDSEGLGKIISVSYDGGRWVVPKSRSGGMYVESGCEPPVNVQPRILSLSKRFFTDKNSRNNNHSQGQMQLGWTNQCGKQCTQVLGINAPYENKNYKDLKKFHPNLMSDIQLNLNFMWQRLQQLYPLEAFNMLQTSKTLRFGDTGFVKVSIGTNFDAVWHRDKTNQKDAIQAVLILGQFVGGDVCLDTAGRTGKIQQCKTSDGVKYSVDKTRSNGSEADIIRIKNVHGTFFCGSYKSIWHSVRPIVSGHRTIIAAYCREDLAKFDRVARASYGMDMCLQLHARRLNILRWHEHQYAQKHKHCLRKKCTCGFVKLKTQLKACWKQADLNALAFLKNH